MYLAITRPCLCSFKGTKRPTNGFDAHLEAKLAIQKSQISRYQLLPLNYSFSNVKHFSTTNSCWNAPTSSQTNAQTESSYNSWNAEDYNMEVRVSCAIGQTAKGATLLKTMIQKGLPIEKKTAVSLLSNVNQVRLGGSEELQTLHQELKKLLTSENKELDGEIRAKFNVFVDKYASMVQP